MRLITFVIALVLLAAGTQAHLCWASGDPHMKNFQGQRWENQFQGDYTLYWKGNLRCDIRQKFYNHRKTASVATRTACQAGKDNIQVSHWNKVTVNGKRIGRGNRNLRGGARLTYHGRFGTVNIHFQGDRVQIQTHQGHRSGNLPRVWQTIWVWTKNTRSVKGMCVNNYDSRRRGRSLRRPILYPGSPLGGKRVKRVAAHHAKLTQQALKRARWVCKDKGLTGNAYQQCVFDVAVTHKARFARGAKRFVQHLNKNFKRTCQNKICHYKRRVRYRQAYKKRISTRVLKKICRHNVAYRKRIRYRKRVVKKWVTYYWRTIPDYKRRNNFKRVAQHRLRNLRASQQQVKNFNKQYHQYIKVSNQQKRLAAQFKAKYKLYMQRYSHYRRVAAHRLRNQRHYQRRVALFNRQYHRYHQLSRTTTKRVRVPKVHKRVHYVWAHKWVRRYRWEVRKHHGVKHSIVTRHRWAHKWVHHSHQVQK